MKFDFSQLPPVYRQIPEFVNGMHFLSGKPRNGKSLLGCMVVLFELMRPEWETVGGYRRRARRMIVTNLGLRISEIQSYMDLLGVDCHVIDWIRLLELDEISEFYRYRDFGAPWPLVSSGAGSMVDYSHITNQDVRVVYMIDEAHIHFNADKWQRIAEAGLHYASQHAKLGDSIYLITQFVEYVAKKFRVLAEDYTYLENESRIKIGRFRKSDKFRWRRWGHVPTLGSLDRAPEEGDFAFPKAEAECYDTAQGVGIPGGLDADKGRKAKGMLFGRFVWGVAVLIVIGLVLGVRGIFWGAEKGAGMLESSLQTDIAKPAPVGGSSRRANAAGAPVSLTMPTAPAVSGGRWRTFFKSQGKSYLLLDTGEVVLAESILSRTGDVFEVRSGRETRILMPVPMNGQGDPVRPIIRIEREKNNEPETNPVGIDVDSADDRERATVQS